ncbi:hypothetical protein DM860_018252 [Cuscuta australis]|uniref:Uncharacterized protein n=1 Tax=Cuscuta australis TaxID=267555 RepID=A0A328D5S9_9ASTE|nr:hypothetical protein DM860_018252 [Cuscuta australis]
MEGSFCQWEVEGPNKESRNASLDELRHLTNLYDLNIEIPQNIAVPEDLFIEMPLERFKIFYGHARRGGGGGEEEEEEEEINAKSKSLFNSKVVQNMKSLTCQGKFAKMKSSKFLWKNDEFADVINIQSLGAAHKVDNKFLQQMKEVVAEQQLLEKDDDNLSGKEIIVFQKLEYLELVICQVCGASATLTIASSFHH